MIMKKWQTCIMPAERRWIDMLLSPDASLCEKNQTIVVSRDKRDLYFFIGLYVLKPELIRFKILNSESLKKNVDRDFR